MYVCMYLVCMYVCTVRRYVLCCLYAKIILIHCLTRHYYAFLLPLKLSSDCRCISLCTAYVPCVSLSFTLLMQLSFLLRNYQRALDLMRRATAMPSVKTSYYDEVHREFYYCLDCVTLQSSLSSLSSMLTI